MGTSKLTKHIELRFLFIQDLVQAGGLKIKKAPTSDNPADVLTKYLQAPTLQKGRRAAPWRHETGIAKAARSATVTVTRIEAGQMTAAAGQAAMEAALASGLSLTALVCANDLLALGAIRALRAHGLSIPEDVSVVGYDDIEFAANAAVPLTSVRQPKYEMGYSAAKLIIGECEDPSSHVHQAVQFQPQLIERQSTAAAARREP